MLLTSERRFASGAYQWLDQLRDVQIGNFWRYRKLRDSQCRSRTARAYAARPSFADEILNQLLGFV